MTTILTFLTVRPSPDFLEFLPSLLHPDYVIYVFIDDNSYHVPDVDQRLRIIKIDGSECEMHGFKSTVLWLDGRACSRDKALYYFCTRRVEYRYIWFIEEDVFVPCTDTIRDIDTKYPQGDLLTQSNIIVYEPRYDWHWPHVRQQTKLALPHACSMICVVRCSKSMLDAINEYSHQQCNLFLDEALFNTLALHHGLNVVTPCEFSTITWNRRWQFHELTTTHLYHPIKSTATQNSFRVRLNQQCVADIKETKTM